MPKRKPAFSRDDAAKLAAFLDRISEGQQYPPLRKLKVGDRVRLVHLPREYVPRHRLHRDTRGLYKYLLQRRRPVTVHEIDYMGLPWIRCQLRGRSGKMEHHFLLIGTETGWAKVKRRRKQRL
jgi:hypothetical protein